MPEDRSITKARENDAMARVRNAARAIADHIDEFGTFWDEDLHSLDTAIDGVGRGEEASAWVESIRELVRGEA